MKKLIYEIPVHDDNDAEMIAREIEAVLGIRPARVEEIAEEAGSQYIQEAAIQPIINEPTDE